MKPKRRKVQRAHLERRLYKTERRIDKFNREALALRQAIKSMDEQVDKIKKVRQETINKALHVAAIESAPANKGGRKDVH
ncbi:hypothetical protein LCGC14_2059210 [marine sediment metagenome]|uniref:Uncharacterized protein n=1 Tax=marine sediment metagenome TaxID=412755 RepID=A0A0F9H068_9ZZZZ